MLWFSLEKKSKKEKKAKIKTLLGNKDVEKRGGILPVICIKPDAPKSSCLRPVPGAYVSQRVTNLNVIIAYGSILECVIPWRIAIFRAWSGIFKKSNQN